MAYRGAQSEVIRAARPKVVPGLRMVWVALAWEWDNNNEEES